MKLVNNATDKNWCEQIMVERNRLAVQKRALKACRAINVRLGVKNAALYSACIEAAGLISAGVIGRLLGMKPITEKGENQINAVMDKLNAAIKT